MGLGDMGQNVMAVGEVYCKTFLYLPDGCSFLLVR